MALYICLYIYMLIYMLTYIYAYIFLRKKKICMKGILPPYTWKPKKCQAWKIIQIYKGNTLRSRLIWLWKLTIKSNRIQIAVNQKSNCVFQFSSVQFSRSVVSDSLRPHELQHARPPCPSPVPRVHSDSRPSSQWCHPAISSLVVPFSSCPQSFPALGSFPMSQVFTWGSQSTGVSALASFLPQKS